MNLCGLGEVIQVRLIYGPQLSCDAKMLSSLYINNFLKANSHLQIFACANLSSIYPQSIIYSPFIHHPFTIHSSSIHHPSIIHSPTSIISTATSPPACAPTHQVGRGGVGGGDEETSKVRQQLRVRWRGSFKRTKNFGWSPASGA